jgi:hypothetical protein
MFKAKIHSSFRLWSRLLLAGHCLAAIHLTADDGQQFTASFHGGTIQAETQVQGELEHVMVRATSASGLVLWERSVASGEVFDFRGFAVDRQGNLFLCGFVPVTMTFGTGVETITIDNMPGPFAIFSLAVVKLDAEGSAQWANTVEWPNWERPVKLALDPAGNVYVTWTFDLPGYCVLQAGAQEMVITRLAGYATAVLARFSQAGDVDWLRRIGDAESTELSLQQNRLSVVLRGLREVQGQTTVTPTFETPDGILMGPTMNPDSDRITAEYNLKGELLSVEGPHAP